MAGHGASPTEHLIVGLCIAATLITVSYFRRRDRRASGPDRVRVRGQVGGFGARAYSALFLVTLAGSAAVAIASLSGAAHDRGYFLLTVLIVTFVASGVLLAYNEWVFHRLRAHVSERDLTQR